MKKYLLIFFYLANVTLSAQINWRNYSTSYDGRKNSDAIPLLVTAIPYNGIYSNFNDTVTLQVLERLKNVLPVISSNSRQFYVYDSDKVYFLAPGIFKNNAGDYEFCVLLNGETFIKPWSNIENFTPIGLNNFKPDFAYLGGYKTTWNNFIIAEIRRKKNYQILSTSLVYWKEQKPALLNVYSSEQLPEVLEKLKNIYFDSTDTAQIEKVKHTYTKDEIDSATHLPKKFIFSSSENNLFFFVDALVFKKAALEYSLTKNNVSIIAWKHNDFDNHFIWLKDLSPGNYILNVRYSRQRQSISAFTFQIKPAWQQTLLFKITSSLLILAFIGFIIALIRLQHQKKLSQKQKKEKLNLQLKSVRSQLNPHFIFNSLNSIQSLINKNEVTIANKYLGDFAQLMRETLDSSNKENNTLKKEIEILNNYLQLEQLRFNFNYSITSSLNNSEIEIPALLLQPIVENAVKHGVSALQEAGKILISFEHSENDVLITISDNGKGFDLNAKSAGYGLKLTKDRIALINQMLTKQSIIMDIKTDEGTAVNLILKNWLA